jgi:flagellar hook-associated protein 2
LTTAHLSTNNTVRGHLAEDGVALYNLSRFSGVTDGSFLVDGHTVDVSTSDTIQSLISKINDSGARVTAAFDAETNKITLTTAFNTEDDVSIGSDTSGLLAAAGISSVNTAKGNIRDHQQVLSKTSQFGSVASGSFTINGVSISIDKDTDTLTSVIDRNTTLQRTRSC